MTTAERLFTIDEANRTLPYVRRVVTDLVRDYRAWQDTVAEYDLSAGKARASADGTPGGVDDTRALEKRAAALASNIESYLAEIAAVGAEVKGFAEGLVDFPGELDGKPVRWCWMLGEPAVEHWHDAESGFGGRQPVTGLASVPEDR